LYLCYNAAMIIDFHTHIFSPQIVREREEYLKRDPLFSLLYSSPKAKLSTAEDLIRTMDEQGIDLSVVQNIAWSDPGLCRQTNDYIMESVSRYPARLSGFGMVVFDSTQTALKEIERCAQGGMRGIGELRLVSQLLANPASIQPVIQSIMEHDLILLIHSSEPLGHIYAGKGDITPQYLYSFISAFPGLKMVCAHWGGGLPFYTLMPEVKKALEHVYFDSAASPFLYNPEIYRYTASLAGEDKVLFGTDYPVLQPKRLLGEIETLGLPAELKQKILSGNARRLLGI
jgi:uncharacterized protein